jgi:hypothetical protein
MPLDGNNMQTPSETYKYLHQTECGESLVLCLFGDINHVRKITLGNRFCDTIKSYPLQHNDYQSAINMMFEFYHHYAPLLQYEELAKGWHCFTKAKRFHSDTTQHVFWNLMDGKKLKRLDRKGGVFQWV